MTKPARPAVARFEPRNPSQALAVRLYSSCDVLVLTGAAGTGKSVCAAGLAATDVLSGGPRDRVVVLRPAVEAGERLGFLPGDVGDKLSPYTQPVRQAMARVAFGFPADQVSYEAVGLCRGVTYERSVVILDEGQNCSWSQLVLVLTRLGRDSKLVVTGDPDQSDVRGTGPRFHCDLDEVTERLRGEPGVGVVEFPAGECLRHPLVGRLLRRLQPR